jgi:hypothetical protein
MVDMILFCDLETTAGEDGKPVQRRVIRTKPHVSYEAGDRTGQLPEVLDLDFAKFLQAFSGQKSAATSVAPAQNQQTAGTVAATQVATQQKPRAAVATR